MLSNAYFVIFEIFLAKFRFDTAENEPAKNLQNFRKMHFRKMHFRKMHFRKMHFRKCIFDKAQQALARLKAAKALEAGDEEVANSSCQLPRLGGASSVNIKWKFQN